MEEEGSNSRETFKWRVVSRITAIADLFLTIVRLAVCIAHVVLEVLPELLRIQRNNSRGWEFGIDCSISGVLGHFKHVLWLLWVATVLTIVIGFIQIFTAILLIRATTFGKPAYDAYELLSRWRTVTILAIIYEVILPIVWEQSAFVSLVTILFRFGFIIIVDYFKREIEDSWYVVRPNPAGVGVGVAST